MRILYQVGTATPYVLATSDSGHAAGVHVGPAGGVGGSNERSVQMQQILRGQFQSVRGRKNRVNTITFSSAVLFNSLAEARGYRMTYPDSIPDEGKLRVEDKTDAGATVVWEMTNAAVRSIVCEPMGLTLKFHYTIVGGAIINGTT